MDALHPRVPGKNVLLLHFPVTPFSHRFDHVLLLATADRSDSSASSGEPIVNSPLPTTAGHRRIGLQSNSSCARCRRAAADRSQTCSPRDQVPGDPQSKRPLTRRFSIRIDPEADHRRIDRVRGTNRFRSVSSRATLGAAIDRSIRSKGSRTDRKRDPIPLHV